VLDVPFFYITPNNLAVSFLWRFAVSDQSTVVNPTWCPRSPSLVILLPVRDGMHAPTIPSRGGCSDIAFSSPSLSFTKTPYRSQDGLALVVSLFFFLPDRIFSKLPLTLPFTFLKKFTLPKTVTFPNFLLDMYLGVPANRFLPYRLLSRFP